MIRRCDGNDPNLTRPVRDGEQLSGPWPDSVPCDCGAVFDDVDRFVTYPHQPIGGGVDLSSAPF